MKLNRYPQYQEQDGTMILTRKLDDNINPKNPSPLSKTPLPIIKTRRRLNPTSRTPKPHRLRLPHILLPFILKHIVANTQIPLMLPRPLALMIVDLAVLPSELHDAGAEVESRAVVAVNFPDTVEG